MEKEDLHSHNLQKSSIEIHGEWVSKTVTMIQKPYMDGGV
jgi:hypothetical protein